MAHDTVINDKATAQTTTQQWFVAYVRTKSEKTTAAALANLGITTYVPTQLEIKVWRNGRRAKQERVVLPNLLLVHCTEHERKTCVAAHPNVVRFMMNRAASLTASGFTRVAIVPQREIDLLKFLLGQSEVPVTLTAPTLVKGQHVRVTGGSLHGLEGTVVHHAGQHHFVVELDVLGCAHISIEENLLEPA